MNRPSSRFFVHGIFLLAGLAGPAFSSAPGAEPAAAPAATTASPAGSAGTATAPTNEQDALNKLHPAVRYSPWLFVGLTGIVFALLIYNEWNQRRQNRPPGTQNKDGPGQN